MSKPVSECDWFRRHPNGGGTVFLRPETSREQDEDEVLVDWLRRNYPTLPTREKRDTVRRLCTEFGYTNRGLGQILGVPPSTIRHLRASDEQLERYRNSKRIAHGGASRISTARIRGIADQWQDRAARGLSPAEALELIGQLRDLCPKSSAA